MLIRTSRLSRGKRPSGPFGVNWDCHQANKIIGWWPIASWAPTAELIAGYTIQSNANALYRPGFDAMVLDTTNVSSTHSANPIVPHTTRFTTDYADGGLYWTFSCWVRPLTTTPSDCGVFTKWDSRGWMLFVHNQIPRAYTGGTHVDGATQLVNDPSRWYFLAGTQDPRGGGTINLYVDGVRDATGGVDGSVASTCDLQWGNYNSSTGTPNDIQVADCRFYGRALDAEEIYTLWDPKSRWDLYWQPSSRAFLDLGAAAAATPYDWIPQLPQPDRTPPAVVGYET